MTSESIPPVVRPHRPPAVTLAQVARRADARPGSDGDSVVVTGIALIVQAVEFLGGSPRDKLEYVPLFYASPYQDLQLISLT